VEYIVISIILRSIHIYKMNRLKYFLVFALIFIFAGCTLKYKNKNDNEKKDETPQYELAEEKFDEYIEYFYEAFPAFEKYDNCTPNAFLSTDKYDYLLINSRNKMGGETSLELIIYEKETHKVLDRHEGYIPIGWGFTAFYQYFGDYKIYYGSCSSDIKLNDDDSMEKAEFDTVMFLGESGKAERLKTKNNSGFIFVCDTDEKVKNIITLTGTERSCWT
jgi:hypothetical protein